MWIQQKIGPFPANKPIIFKKFAKKELQEGVSGYAYKYVRLGIQCPQSPYVTEARDINYKNFSHGKLPIVLEDKDIKNTNSEKWMNGVRKKDDKVKIENLGKMNKMNRFRIDVIDPQKSDITYYINENEILEFSDFDAKWYFKVMPLQPVNEYTIIEIQYSDDL